MKVGGVSALVRWIGVLGGPKDAVLEEKFGDVPHDECDVDFAVRMSKRIMGLF